MNVFTFSGNLGGDAETRPVGSTTVCNFNVAVTAGYGDKKQTIWVRCALWGQRAESGLVDYLKKGQQVVVSGEISTHEYESKTYVQVRVNDVTLVGGKAQGGGSVSAAAPASPPPTPAPEDDDIPF